MPSSTTCAPEGDPRDPAVPGLGRTCSWRRWGARLSWRATRVFSTLSVPRPGWMSRDGEGSGGRRRSTLPEGESCGVEYQIPIRWGAIRLPATASRGLARVPAHAVAVEAAPGLGSFAVRLAHQSLCLAGRFRRLPVGPVTPGASFDCPYESRFVPRRGVRRQGREGLGGSLARSCRSGITRHVGAGVWPPLPRPTVAPRGGGVHHLAREHPRGRCRWPATTRSIPGWASRSSPGSAPPSSIARLTADWPAREDPRLGRAGVRKRTSTTMAIPSAVILARWELPASVRKI